MSSQNWETPQALFDLVNDEFEFELDVCADKHNTKCKRFFSEGALAKSWNADRVWCNPPFAKPMPWVVKAHEQAQFYGTVVMLLNCDPSTKWYAKALETAAEIRILTGKRIQFITPPGVKESSNPKSQMLIIFRKTIAPCHIWHWDWSNEL